MKKQIILKSALVFSLFFIGSCQIINIGSVVYFITYKVVNDTLSHSKNDTSIKPNPNNQIPYLEPSPLKKQNIETIFKNANYKLMNSSGGDIVIAYDKITINLEYETLLSKSKLKSITTKITEPEMLNFMKGESEEIHEKIRVILNSAKSDNETETELINIAKKLYNQEEIELYVESLDFNPNSSYLTFKTISDKEFYISINEKDLFLAVYDEINSKRLFIKQANLILDNDRVLRDKTTNYPVYPLISLESDQKISKVTSFGNVYATKANNESEISLLSINKFKNPEKLKVSNSIYEATEDSGNALQVNIKQTERLRIKS